MSVEYRLCYKNMLGTLVEVGQSYRILKGSQAVAPYNVWGSMEAKDRAIHAGLVKEGILVYGEGGYFVFTEDYYFSSISEAANVVIGGHVNGYSYWKRVEARYMA